MSKTDTQPWAKGHCKADWLAVRFGKDIDWRAWKQKTNTNGITTKYTHICEHGSRLQSEEQREVCIQRSIAEEWRGLVFLARRR